MRVNQQRSITEDSDCNAAVVPKTAVQWSVAAAGRGHASRFAGGSAQKSGAACSAGTFALETLELELSITSGESTQVLQLWRLS